MKMEALSEEEQDIYDNIDTDVSEEKIAWLTSLVRFGTVYRWWRWCCSRRSWLVVSVLSSGLFSPSRFVFVGCLIGVDDGDGSPHVEKKGGDLRTQYKCLPSFVLRSTLVYPAHRSALFWCPLLRCRLSFVPLLLTVLLLIFDRVCCTHERCVFFLPLLFAHR